MDLVQKKQIADSVKNFFNSLPKDVVGVTYDLESKSVTVKFKQVEQPKPNSKKEVEQIVEELYQDLKKLEFLLKLKA